ncbi:asparaginase [Brachybacterium sp. GCM10030267]|uniref:asparaginase n=1 Tax=unclassified Brachybacterium TaxID=2623841 RepID=UPI00360EB9BC
MSSVSLLSLGGTIFMSQDAAGLGAAPDGSAGASLTPSVIDGVAVTHREITNVGSPSVRPEHLRDVLRNAREAVDHGATGVVVSHGTDTLEESAFLLNLYWDRDAPLVLTGAMRPSNAPGADGPANIRDAVRTAVAPSARGLGVLAVFDASVHLAEQVTKTSSRSIDAFTSEPSGPVALVGEHDVRLLYRPLERSAARHGELPAKLPNVPILMGGVGEDFTLLDALPAGTLDGLVVAGVGMGHVAADAVPRLAALVDAGTPVVVATRIPSGGTSDRHYDYPGSEKDLISRGVVMAGALSPQKARLLLQVLLADGAHSDKFQSTFARYAH